MIHLSNEHCSAVEAALPTPWRRYPKEAAAYLRMSPESFRRKVRGKVPCKKSGGVELYHVKDLDQWDDNEKATNSNHDEAAESSMSQALPLTGALCIGPLERALAKKLRNGSR
jgi:hypothetical protein